MGSPHTGLPTLVERRIENRVTGLRARTDRRSLETSGPNATGSRQTGRGDVAQRSMQAGRKTYGRGLDNSGNIEGRYEGTELFLGRRETIGELLCHRPQRRQSLHKCLVQPIWVHRCSEIKSGHATDDRLRRVPGKWKKSKKPLRGGVCLLTKGVLTSVMWLFTAPALFPHFCGLPLAPVLAIPASEGRQRSLRCLRVDVHMDCTESQKRMRAPDSQCHFNHPPWSIAAASGHFACQ